MAGNGAVCFAGCLDGGGGHPYGEPFAALRAVTGRVQFRQASAAFRALLAASGTVRFQPASR
ncbi:MAG: hypothetical protein M1399_03835 [Actinobacteria bacterium]|nr:hypothetical protein [Actinomycetota bacterium]